MAQSLSAVTVPAALESGIFAASARAFRRLAARWFERRPVARKVRVTILPPVEREPDAPEQFATLRRHHGQAQGWYADMYSNAQERRPKRASYKPRSRAKVEKVEARVHVPLSKEDAATALALLQDRPVRHSLDRDEWLSEAWLELVNPTATAASTPAASLAVRVERAVWRAERRMRKHD